MSTPPPNQPPSPSPPDPTPPEKPASPWIYSGAGGGGAATPPGESGYYTPPVPRPVPSGAAPGPSAAPGAAGGGAVTPPPTPRPMVAASAGGGAATASAARPQTTQAGGGGEMPSDASLASIIDTIEAIIIALIIALTFRAFIVEAFVIPTGSMAPTLLGAHFKVVCPRCGYSFDLDAELHWQAGEDEHGRLGLLDVNEQHAELRANSYVFQNRDPVYCPNCRYQMLATNGTKDGFPQWLRNAEVIMQPGASRGEVFPFIWANNGDRILVLKYLYSVMNPHRWDVIVFKEPMNARDNYIKRLIGLPKETVEIVNGDIFIGPPDHPDAKDRQIARKPEYLQPYLWQLVYDNDYYPVDEGAGRMVYVDGGQLEPRRIEPGPPWTNPWQPDARAAADWERNARGGIGATPTYKGNGPSTLTFDIRPAYAAAMPYTLNTLGYNDDLYARIPPMQLSLVGDLRLETLWRPTAADAAGISVTLGRPNNCYRVTWNRSGLALEHLDVKTGKFEAVAGAELEKNLGAPQTGKAYALAYENVDHASRFYINGKKVLSYEKAWNVIDARQDAEEFPPDWPVEDIFRNRSLADRANTRISIEVAGPCTLAHVKLMRDLYYTQILDTGGHYVPHPGTMDSPLTLKEDQFFALGDNSRKSSDGRLWDKVYAPLNDLELTQGIVPRRYLLGKAFFVYWPAGFRPEPLPWLRDFPIVPDAGDMRIIR